MTVEIRYQDPSPEPLTSFTEIHVDPTTGENERGLMLGGLGADISGGATPDQLAALSPSALPQGWERTGRNALCPCGSGRKFKHCHGSLI